MERKADLVLVTKQNPTFVTVYNKTTGEVITINRNTGASYSVVDTSYQKQTYQEHSGPCKRTVYSKEDLAYFEQMIKAAQQ